jgi:hypothetical protein
LTDLDTGSPLTGYSPQGFFVLPETCWREAYHRPLQVGVGDFLNHHGHSEAARAVVADHEQEIALFEAQAACFSYGVYAAKKLA